MKMMKIAAAAAVFAMPVLAQAGDGLTVSGHADFSVANYSHDGVVGASTGLGAPGLGVDDSFQVNQVMVTLSKAPVDGFSGVVQLVGGEEAAFIPANSGGGDIALAQAYFQYNSGALTVTAGKYFTLAGSEVFASTGNAQITRGLLYALQPFNHTGVRASYALSDSFSLTGGLVNSAFAGGSTTDNNEAKTIEVSAGFTPAEGLSMALTGYFGTENGPGLKSDIIDFVANWQLSKAFTLGLNVDIGSSELAPGVETEATGIAVYAGAQLTDSFKLSGRYETLTVETGGAEVKPSEITVTGAFAVAKNFDFLAEVRMDDQDANVFEGGTEDQATTIGLKGIFKF